MKSDPKLWLHKSVKTCLALGVGTPGSRRSSCKTVLTTWNTKHHHQSQIQLGEKGQCLCLEVTHSCTIFPCYLGINAEETQWTTTKIVKSGNELVVRRWEKTIQEKPGVGYKVTRWQPDRGRWHGDNYLTGVGDEACHHLAGSSKTDVLSVKILFFSQIARLKQFRPNRQNSPAILSISTSLSHHFLQILKE